MWGLSLQTAEALRPGRGVCLLGDLPKQVKLKKPSRLKTLDTKPGLCSSSPGTQRQALGPGRGGQWGWQ